MRKTFVFSLIVLGFTSLVSQVVLTRELAMSFYANEFFIGWVLFCWLFGTAAGSLLSSRFSKDTQTAFRFLGICQVLTALLFPAMIVLIRFGRTILGTPAGAVPELFPSLLYSLAVLTPLCAVLGMQFTLVAKIRTLQVPEGGASRTVGKAYFWECLGFIVGGAVFSFALVFANEFHVAGVVAVLNFAAASRVFGSAHLKKTVGRTLATLAVIFPAWLLMNSASLQQQTAQARFPNETLLRTRNTVHGNVAVTQLGHQNNFYQSGLLLGAAREDLASELLVHFPMLAHTSPQRVLLLGTGFNGPVQQILKHGPREVVAVELDPELLRITEEFLPDDLQKALQDPRVQVRGGDPLDFLKSEGGIFDVIIANFPDPVSVLINRNYTEQFFRLARSHLAPGGIFATHITFAANFITPELDRLGGSVYTTLGRVFGAIQVLPEDTLYFLASTGEASWDAPKVVQRLSEGRLRTDFVTADLIRYRLGNDRVARVAAEFKSLTGETRNSDLHPRACYFAFLRWLSQFDPNIPKIFFFLAGIPFPVMLGMGLLGILLIGLIAKGSAGKARRLALLSMGTAGFSLMAFEILGIYLFQAAFGDLYYRLAWVITAFMAGMGVGTLAGLGLGKFQERHALAVLHMANAAFFLILVKVCGRVFAGGSFTGEISQPAFLGAALLGGLMAGMIFPWANRLYLVRGVGERIGMIYAADLGGSALGALLTAGFLMPVWGVPQTLLSLGTINVLLALLLFLGKDLGRKDL